MTARRIITLTAALTAALTTVALAAPARKAALDPGGAAYTWTGGPISGAAATTDVGDTVPCGPGKECDETLLKTSDRGQINVKTDSADNKAADMDLYVYQSDATGKEGKFLKSSAGGTPKEEVTANVPAGYYLVRMVAAASVGGTYEGQALLKALPPLTAEGGPDFGADPASGLGDGSSGNGSSGTGGTGGTPGGNTTAGLADDLAPSAKVRRPRGRVRTLRGTATDPDGRIAYVDVSVVRISGGRCSSLTAAGRFKAVKKCTTGPFLRARGGASWRLTLKRALPPGSYLVLARATDDKGRAEGGFGPANRRRFRVR
jgi:hypothetical protein